MNQKGPSGYNFAAFIVLAVFGGYALYYSTSTTWVVVWVIISLLIAASFRVANEWERAIVLRVGHFSSIQGPGLFFLIPFLDRVSSWVDLRIRATTFRAEQTLTRDTVPVDVDGVFYWHVQAPKESALEVENYVQAISWTAQTALRDIIGRSLLAELLSERQRIDVDLQSVMEKRASGWGIEVQSVELRDVAIPLDLQNAMSREAQAERERRARAILGQAEVEVAKKFVDAAALYAGSPTALHLRAMNMLYEGLKEKGAMMIIPSSAVESMNLGSMAGLAALAEQQKPKS